jgi:hypothetical protein
VDDVVTWLSSLPPLRWVWAARRHAERTRSAIRRAKAEDSAVRARVHRRDAQEEAAKAVAARGRAEARLIELRQTGHSKMAKKIEVLNERS